jgi:hypothetical protein
MDEATDYLAGYPDPVLAQTYHAGPGEAGIFYYRHPDEEAGHIFSVTAKVFPDLTGDGRSTLEQLIWRHPRFRMQAAKFLKRHADNKDLVLGEGETMRLAVCGNHAQGTMFIDGGHWITPELERRIDEISKHYDGFYIGRYDLRFTDEVEFMAGRDLAIVELNGVAGTSSNIYDPSSTLLRAYLTLRRQWRLLYRIGDANRRRGHRPYGFFRLLREVFVYFRRHKPDPVAD